MRILILANNDVGLYKFRKELIEELIGKGNEVYISLPEGEFVNLLQNIGCFYINTLVDRRGINPKTDFGLFRQYKKIIKKYEPDLIITYTIKPNIYGGLSARITQKQYAVNITGLGTAFERKGLIRCLVILLYKLALKRVKVVFVENQEIGKIVDKYRLCDKNKIVILNGAGVNTSDYPYQEYPHNDIIYFLFIGRVMKEKGIDELLAATKKIVDDGDLCRLDIVGPLEENYKSVLEKYEKEGWLSYNGFQEDVRPFIKNCDCFVLPSYHEGMANTNLECASSGRPLITSNIPGCKEAVIEGVSGYLCEPQDVDSLYIEMKKMISSDCRAEMGVSGRNHMLDKFSKESVVEKTIERLFYES